MKTIIEGMSLPGEHASTLHGGGLLAGVYLLRLEAGDVVCTIKLVLLR